MQHFYRTDRYMRLVELNLAGDLVGMRRLIDSAVAETAHREKAFWLLVRAAGMIQLPAAPIPVIMEDVRAALALAPGDIGTEEHALLNLLALVARTERWEEGPRWIGMLHRVMREASEPFMLWFNLGVIQWRRTRPRAAIRNYTRALTGMYTLAPERRIANLGRFYAGHCYRAMAAVEVGLSELADRDLEAAEKHLKTANRAEDILFYLAHSAVALAAGDGDRARKQLQWIRAQEQAGKYLRTAYTVRAEVEMQAARIALAEGNQLAFEHFTGRAMTIAREHQLGLTIRRIMSMRSRVLGETAAIEL